MQSNSSINFDHNVAVFDRLKACGSIIINFCDRVCNHMQMLYTRGLQGAGGLTEVQVS